MKEVYYQIIPDGYDKKSGNLYAPDDWPYPITTAGKEVKDWDKLEVELRDGEYAPYHRCVSRANMVSEELKALLEEYIGENENIEFLPVKAKSKEYGDRTYYILHFRNKPEDVISEPHSDYYNGHVLRYALDYDKVKGKKIFNVQGEDIHISADIAKAIKKRKLTGGMELAPIASFSSDE